MFRRRLIKLRMKGVCRAGVVVPASILALAASAAAQNSCDAEKLTCVKKSLSCLMSVHARATKRGIAPDEINSTGA
jgi:hypothetical protein